MAATGDSPSGTWTKRAPDRAGERRLAALAVSLYTQTVAELAPAGLIRRWIRRDGSRLVLRGVGPGGRALRVPIAKLFVLAAGKASMGFAEAVAALAPDAAGIAICPAPAWTGDGVRPPQRRSPPLRRGRIRVLFGEHPYPGAGSYCATAAALRAIDQLPPDATILFLLSGGASALFAAPPPGVSRTDKTRLHRLLVGSGLPIEAINTVRRRISAVKGGGLTERASPRKVVTYVLSDVLGDVRSAIGSGPTVPEPRGHSDVARRLLVRRGLWAQVPRSIRDYLDQPVEGAAARSRAGPYRIIASARTAREALVRRARALGFEVRQSRRPLAGEASECGRRMGAALPRRPKRPTAFVATGETVVTLPAAGCSGQGGRCQELVLGAAEPLAGSGWVLLAAGTDGVDGASPAAGGFVDGASFRQIGSRRLRAALRSHQSTAALASIGGLVVIGPTGTNVGDVLLALHPGESSARPIRPGRPRKRPAERRDVAARRSPKRRFAARREDGGA